MDLVLINPGSRPAVYQSLASTLAAIEPPVWAGLMATFVRNHGFSVEIVDADADNLTPKQVAARLRDIRPLLAAVVVYGHQPSASTQNMTAAGAICRAVKELDPEQNLLLVGGHVAALPKRTIDEEAADFVAGGEGLYTMVDLLQALRAKTDDYRNVRGLWFRQDKEICSTDPAPLVQDVDRHMPMIAWDLLQMHKYRAHNWHCFGDLQRQPYAAIYTSLGCPFHCTFCCIQSPFKDGEAALGLKLANNSYRLWSPEAVVAQIDLLVQKYGVRNIKIADEMFVLTPKHVEGICDRLIERGYNLNIWAYARVDTVKDGMVDKLKRAGFNWIAFGIEAANEHVRDGVQKGFGQNEVYDTIKKVRAAGINIIGNYIFGLPDDDLSSMQETLEMALDLQCEFANFYSTMAYPGSPLYDVAIKSGWPLPKSWSGYSQHSIDTLPLPTKYLSAADVLRFRDDAFQKYFGDASYLGMIREKFGQQTAEHIREMASHKLVRKFAD